MWQRFWWAAGLSTAMLCAPVDANAEPADAATRDAARTLGLSGVEAFQDGNFDAASSKLEKAYSILSVPTIGVWSARALAKRGHLVEAANRYQDVLSLELPDGDAAIQRAAQTEARSELDALRPQLPRLVVRARGVDPADANLTIDAVAMPSSILGKPRFLNPGRHTIELTAGGQKRSAFVELERGKEAVIELEFAGATSNDRSAPRPAVTKPSTSDPTARPDGERTGSGMSRTLGWAAIGVGGVGIGIGAATGIVALGKAGALKDSGVCVAQRCPPEKQGEVDSLGTMRTLSTTSFIVGGVLAGTGLILLLSAPSDQSRVTATFEPRGVSLRGEF